MLLKLSFNKKKKESLLLSPVMLSCLQCGWFSSLIIAFTQQWFISFSWMTKRFVQMVMHVRSEASSAASLLAHNGTGGEWWQCLGTVLKLPEGYMIANCLELKESVFVFNCCLAARHMLRYSERDFFSINLLYYFYITLLEVHLRCDWRPCFHGCCHGNPQSLPQPWVGVWFHATASYANVVNQENKVNNVPVLCAATEWRGINYCTANALNHTNTTVPLGLHHH